MTDNNKKFLRGGPGGAVFTKSAPPGRRRQKRKEFFENLACDWDDEHHTPGEIEGIRIFAETHFQVKKAETVLDIGCGTGRLIPYLEKMIGHAGKLVELDFSIKMLKIAKKRHNHRDLLFIQGDGHALPLKDHSIDTVICLAFFPHLADKLTGMRAMARVLKPGGKLIIAHQMNREELNRFHGNIDGPVSDDLLPGQRKMRELFEAAGFRDVDIREAPGLYLATANAGFQPQKA